MKMKIESIYEALDVLKQGMILIEEKKRTIVFIRDGIIHLKSTQWNSKVSENDFLTLFDQSVFYIYESNQGSEISDEKDAEYYAWRSRSQ